MDLRRVRCIVFDLDGTLVDTTELILHAFREAFTAAGLPVPPGRELLALIGRPLVRQMAALSPGHADRLVALYQEAYERSHDALARSFPGIREALGTLRERGYSLGIATSKRDFTTGRALDYFGLKPFFEAVVTANDTRRHKPDPEPLLEALRRLGAGPEEATYIGDSTHDIRCAHAAGVAAGAVAWSPFEREQLEAEKPDYWIGEPASLEELFPGPPHREEG